MDLRDIIIEIIYYYYYYTLLMSGCCCLVFGWTSSSFLLLLLPPLTGCYDNTLHPDDEQYGGRKSRAYFILRCMSLRVVSLYVTVTGSSSGSDKFLFRRTKRTLLENIINVWARTAQTHTGSRPSFPLIQNCIENVTAAYT